MLVHERQRCRVVRLSGGVRRISNRHTGSDNLMRSMKCEEKHRKSGSLRAANAINNLIRSINSFCWIARHSSLIWREQREWPNKKWRHYIGKIPLQFSTQHRFSRTTQDSRISYKLLVPKTKADARRCLTEARVPSFNGEMLYRFETRHYVILIFMYFL